MKLNNIGVNFGITSGVITSLGLIIGLYSGTESLLAIVGGIITIAIADSLSDGLGIHISKESEKGSDSREVWSATFMTVISKTVVSISFLLPVLVFELNLAVIICIIWGLFIIVVLSVLLAKNNNDPVHWVVLEHVSIATLVIVLTYGVGKGVAHWFA